MENILIILFITWLNSHPSLDFEAKYIKFICETRYHTECGLYQDPRNPSTYLNCGDCPDHQMCGADFPSDNGTLRFGSPGQCGGGCINTNSFQCENNGAAVVCSRLYDQPQDNCIMVEEPENPDIATNKWCCY